jgi:murein DD-endopeptidase MepM/ murein hydrolase activator NlpD
MKLILVNQRYGHSRTIVIKGWLKGLLSICLLGAPVAMGYLGYHLAVSQSEASGVVSRETADSWQQKLDEQSAALVELRQNAELQLEALTTRLASLQARLLRLDALGERLTVAANLDPEEFNFSQGPAVGGLLINDPTSMSPPDFIRAISNLEDEIGRRGEQLEAIGSVLSGRQLADDMAIAGRPVTSGWLSSGFGRRPDPFTGRMAWHNGVDFAAPAGEDIISVGSGVVTFAGNRPSYGLTVEIDHGNGYLTRYAHAQELLVEPGEIVNQGQLIALIGSTGRSTGPHVHFEIYKNGRAVDPASYIRRTLR